MDCCEKPSGVSLSDYITMIVAVNKLDTAVMAMNPSSAIYGSWNTLREPITSTWSAVKEPLCLHGTLSWGLGHQRLLARERSKLRLALCRC
nr:IncF plasmid conjugative transfer protein TraN [Proteus terrae subsp. cibarius]